MVSPSSPGLPANAASAPAHQRPWVRALLGVASGPVVLMWSVFVIAWLALHGLILPHIDEWRPAIKRRADRPAPTADATTTAPARGAAPSTDPRPPG